MEPALRNKTFQLLLSCWMVANIAMWMTDVSAAWIMTSLTTDPLWIALVQSCSTLPIFFLGLPIGALADMVDRRKLFIFTQVWGAGVAVLFTLAWWFDWLGPVVILLLVLANGCGLAMRWPVFSAIIPNVVARNELRGALAMNSLTTNASRVVGPLCAGLLIAAAGPGWVFACNIVLCGVTSVILIRWKHVQAPRTRPPEALLQAMVGGVVYIRRSRAMHVIMLRTILFFSHGIVVLALMPLIAHGLPNAGADTFGVLLASLGIGAIIGAIFIPRVGRSLGSEKLLRTGRIGHAIATVALAFAPNLLIAVPAMMVAGLFWMTSGNTMTVVAQLHLPDHIRARGMAMYQTAIMGSGALGAACWGQVASLSSVRTSMLLSAALALVGVLCTWTFRLPQESTGAGDPAP